ncbi:hypothetical protein HZS_7591, partial [Henneguya salminicola]
MLVLDVGRSCIIVCMGGKRIMLDCGMHMCYSDAVFFIFLFKRKYPDFSFITKTGTLNDFIDCVLISHFHLDHCGSLPFMTEQIGFDGPIYMTTPTKAIAKILIEDMRRIMEEKKTESDLFTPQMINDCFDKISDITLHEVVKIGNIEIKAYYAGHVLGAVMFYIRVGHESVVYTGDFNMTSDSHLGAAWIDRCEPDVLITESTYATTIRESRKCRENDMLAKIHQVIETGGKVLVPVFALGRAQEICLLLERYWDRKNITVPIYMSTGMAEKAVNYYKLFISWTNQTFKKVFYNRNLFEFNHTLPFDRSLVDAPGPMVVLASPGMLHAGLSCFIFKKWASDPLNAIILPGYCAVGTIGHKVLSGQKKIENDDRIGSFIDVKMQVLNMSFSAHADSVGILQLIDYCRPKKAVVLVHGELEGMKTLSEGIESEFNLKCYYPSNGEILTINVKDPPIKALISTKSVSRLKAVMGERFHALLSIQENPKYPIKITHLDDRNSLFKKIILSTSFTLNIKKSKAAANITYEINTIVEQITKNITKNHPGVKISQKDECSLSVESFQASISSNFLLNPKTTISVSYNVSVSWDYLDQDIADSILKLIKYTFDQISS